MVFDGAVDRSAPDTAGRAAPSRHRALWRGRAAAGGDGGAGGGSRGRRGASGRAQHRGARAVRAGRRAACRFGRRPAPRARVCSAARAAGRLAGTRTVVLGHHLRHKRSYELTCGAQAVGGGSRSARVGTSAARRWRGSGGASRIRGGGERTSRVRRPTVGVRVGLGMVAQARAGPLGTLGLSTLDRHPAFPPQFRHPLRLDSPSSASGPLFCHV